MPRFHPCRLLILALLSSPTAPAQSSEWSSDRPLAGQASEAAVISRSRVRLAPNGGHFLFLSLDDQRELLAHIDAQEQLLSLRPRLGAYESSDAFYSQPGSGQLLQDGRLYDVGQCGMTARNDDGSVRWVGHARYGDCSVIADTPDGAVWIRHHTGVGRLDPVGREVIDDDQARAQERRYSSLAATDDEGVYASVNGQTSAVVHRLDADAADFWQVELPRLQPDSQCKHLQLVPRTGGVRAACFPWNEQYPTEYWHLNGSGEVLAQGLLEHRLTDLGWRDPLRAELRRGLEIRHNDTGGMDLFRLDDDGRVVWQGLYPAQLAVETSVVTSEGDIRLITGVTELEPLRNTYDFIAVGPDGSVRTPTDLPFYENFGGFDPLRGGEFMASNSPQHRIDGDGQLVFREMPWLNQLKAADDLIVSQSDGGDHFVINRRLQVLTLRRHDRAGQLRWTAELPALGPGVTNVLNGVDMGVSEQVVCVRKRIYSEPPTLTCFARETGTMTWQSDIRLDRATWRLFGSSGLVLIDGGQLRLINALDGSDLSGPVALLEGEHRVVGDHGSSALGLDGQAVASVLLLRDGQVSIQQLALQGALLDVSEQGVLSAGGEQSLRWSPLDGAPELDFDVGSPGRWELFDVQPDRLIVWRTGSGQFSALDLASAEVSWGGDFPLRASVDIVGQYSLIGGRLGATDFAAIASADERDVETVLFRLSTGEFVRELAISCESSRCSFHSGSASAVGLDLLLERPYEDAEAIWSSVHLSTQALTAAATPADQPGVAGAWYDPALPGQGFVLSYIESSRTLFMPWFTYQDATVDANSHNDSALRWYSLQGVAEPGAAKVRLDLLRNTAGAFGEPPVTTAEVVGSAEIWFSSCDRGHLSFRFNQDVARGQRGVIPLHRLGARTRDCDRGALGIEAAQAGSTPAAGFSPSQSGAWFDPASSGQGLMVEVVPADATQSGLLFATWFTYDLAGQSDDPGAQDWFALQTDLQDAQNGQVTAVIYRSIGGLLDHRPTSNLFRVGEASFEFSGCASLRLRYQFDANALGRRHAGLVGEQLLERIGGCSE